MERNLLSERVTEDTTVRSLGTETGLCVQQLLTNSKCLSLKLAVSYNPEGAVKESVVQ